MTFRTTACCAALLVSLLAPAAQAAPCDGSPCPAARPGKVAKPLQLGQFMRPGAIPVSRKVKPSAQAAKTNSGKPKKALALRKRIEPPDEETKPLATDAASAFASQHEPDVRVVAADELNEIDLAAGPAAPETVGLAPSGDDAVRVVDAAAYNDVDRQGDQGSSPASVPDTVSEPAQPDRPGPTWIEQFWAMLQHAVAALAAGWRALFG
jgi:hypothetical protein